MAPSSRKPYGTRSTTRRSRSRSRSSSEERASSRTKSRSTKSRRYRSRSASCRSSSRSRSPSRYRTRSRSTSRSRRTRSRSRDRRRRRSSSPPHDKTVKGLKKELEALKKQVSKQSTQTSKPTAATRGGTPATKAAGKNRTAGSGGGGKAGTAPKAPGTAPKPAGTTPKSAGTTPKPAGTNSGPNPYQVIQEQQAELTRLNEAKTQLQTHLTQTITALDNARNQAQDAERRMAKMEEAEGLRAAGDADPSGISGPRLLSSLLQSQFAKRSCPFSDAEVLIDWRVAAHMQNFRSRLSAYRGTRDAAIPPGKCFSSGKARYPVHSPFAQDFYCGWGQDSHMHAGQKLAHFDRTRLALLVDAWDRGQRTGFIEYLDSNTTISHHCNLLPDCFEKGHFSAEPNYVNQDRKSCASGDQLCTHSPPCHHNPGFVWQPADDRLDACMPGCQGRWTAMNGQYVRTYGTGQQYIVKHARGKGPPATFFPEAMAQFIHSGQIWCHYGCPHNENEAVGFTALRWHMFLHCPNRLNREDEDGNEGEGEDEDEEQNEGDCIDLTGA